MIQDIIKKYEKIEARVLETIDETDPHPMQKERLEMAQSILKDLRELEGKTGNLGNDEDLAIEVVARFAGKTIGRNGRLTVPMKKEFIAGALWMRERLLTPSNDK